jgi:dienelactone hydrolase
LVCTNKSGVQQLHAWDVGAGEMRQLTSKPEGVGIGYIAPDGEYVYHLRDEHGEEKGHYVRLPFHGGPAEDISPDLPDYSSYGFYLSLDSRVVGFTAAYGEGFRACCVEIGGDGSMCQARQLWRSESYADGPVLDREGAIAVVMSSERSDSLQFSAIALDRASGQIVGELWDGPGTDITPSMFAPLAGDPRLLGTSDRTGSRRPFIWNIRSGERVDMPLSGIDGEVVPLDWSADGKRILLCQFERAVQRLSVYHLETGLATRLDHPAGTLGYYAESGVRFGEDSEITAQWESSQSPARVIALDASTGAMTRTILTLGHPPPGRPWRSITFPSSDGVQVQAWLATPEGQGPFPTILATHGGPEIVTTDSYAPRWQLWLDHGFAVVTVNYRGSVTFGRDFKEKIWHNPGNWEVEDMAAARRHVVDQGVADPATVFLTGWSYGGYLTLQALGKKPELWAGGMAGVAVADWISQFEDESDAMRGVDIKEMGGTPDDRPDAYAAASPITYCDRVVAPVVIIQGRHDSRCPPRQVSLYEARMRELGKDIEVHWFDAGHLVGSAEQTIAHQEIFLRFAFRVLEGRDQLMSTPSTTTN